MEDKLLILHEEAFSMTDEEFSNVQSKLYELSDELYNYVSSSGDSVEDWNEYSETFGKQSFLTVFSCENVEINLVLWEKLVKERKVKELADKLNRDVNEIYSILVAYMSDDEDDCDCENCKDEHRHDHHCHDEHCGCEDCKN